MDALKKEKIKKAAWFEGRKDLKERLSTLDIGDYRKLLTQRNLTYTREDRRQALFERVKNDLENEEVMKNDLLELSDLGVKTVKAIFNGEGVVDVYEYMSIQPIIDLGYFTSISNYRFSYDEETKENVLHILNDPIFEEHRHKYSTMKALELYAAMLYMDIDLDHMYHLWENSVLLFLYWLSLPRCLASWHPFVMSVPELTGDGYFPVTPHITTMISAMNMSDSGRSLKMARSDISMKRLT